MAQSSTDASNVDASFLQTNLELSDFTKWLLEKGDEVTSVIIHAAEKTENKTEISNKLHAINKRTFNLLQIQRLKFEKNGREKSPRIFRAVMYETTRRILTIICGSAEQVAEIYPELGKDIAKTFKGMQKVFSELPEDFKELPKCLRNWRYDSYAPTECDSKIQHGALMLTSTLRSAYTNVVLRNHWQWLGGYTERKDTDIHIWVAGWAGMASG